MNFGLTKSAAITGAGAAAADLLYLATRYSNSQDEHQANDDYIKIMNCLNLVSAMLEEIKNLFSRLTLMDIDEDEGGKNEH